jgi:hypothetical protein
LTYEDSSAICTLTQTTNSEHKGSDSKYREFKNNLVFLAEQGRVRLNQMHAANRAKKAGQASIDLHNQPVGDKR